MFTNGEKPNGKNPLNDFQVTTPESPLLSQQAVTSKGILVPYQPIVETFKSVQEIKQESANSLKLDS